MGKSSGVVGRWGGRSSKGLAGDFGRRATGLASIAEIGFFGGGGGTSTDGQKIQKQEKEEVEEEGVSPVEEEGRFSFLREHYGGTMGRRY